MWPIPAPVRTFEGILGLLGYFLDKALLWMTSTASAAPQQSRVAAYRRAHNALLGRATTINMFRPHKFIGSMKKRKLPRFYSQSVIGL